MAALFQKDASQSAVGNSSLQYKPVKQNPTPAASAASASTPTAAVASGGASAAGGGASGGAAGGGGGGGMLLIHASPVQLYKFEQQQSREVGRRGIALLGSAASGVYQLLCYEPTSKQQDVKIALTSQFQIMVRLGALVHKLISPLCFDMLASCGCIYIYVYVC